MNSVTRSQQTGIISTPAHNSPLPYRCSVNTLTQTEDEGVFNAKCLTLLLCFPTGNGDILSYEDAMKARETGVSGIMVARSV